MSPELPRLIKDVFSGVCNHALDDELIESNPVIGITKRLQLGRDKLEVEPFTLDEMIVLLDTTKTASPEFYAFLAGLQNRASPR